MRLEIFDTPDAKRWDELVSNSVNGTLYHTWSWLKIVEKHSSSKLSALVFFDADDDKPFGAIPLFHMTKFGVKMVFSPPPGSAITLGPVIITKGYKQLKFELAYQEFQAQIDKFIKKIGANYVNIVTSPGLLDIRPFSWAKYEVTPCYTYKIDLSQGEKAIWGNISSRLKRDIKSSLAKGVQVVESPNNRNKNVDYIYDALKNRYSDQHLNFPVQKTYISEILTQFGPSVRVLSVLYEKKTVGAIIFTTYKEAITAWVGGVRFESNDLDVNGCLLWKAIQIGIKDGYRWFENMGANTRQLCASKAKYCPELDIYFTIKKSDLSGRFAEKCYKLLMKNYYY